jgi:hypothetical protein
VLISGHSCQERHCWGERLFWRANRAESLYNASCGAEAADTTAPSCRSFLGAYSFPNFFYCDLTAEAGDNFLENGQSAEGFSFWIGL